MQYFDKFVINPHREINGQSGPEPDTLHLGVFPAVRAPQVGLALTLSHLADSRQYLLKGLVLAHQSISTGDEDVAYLRIVLEVFHQAVQLVRPVLLRLKFLKVEVQMPVLESEHPLAGCAQASAGATHCIWNQDSHIGIASVDVVRIRHYPARRIRLSRLDGIFLLPGSDIAVGVYKFRRIQDIAAYGLVIISAGFRVHQ